MGRAANGGAWFSRLSQNSNSERLFRSKTSNLVKWTKLILADFSSNSRNFTTLHPRMLFLVGFFFEKNFSNIWGIYGSTQQTLFEKDPQGWNSEVSSKNREILPGSRFDPATGVTDWSKLYDLRPIFCGDLSTLLHPVLASSFLLWQDFSKRASFPIVCVEWFYKKAVWCVIKSWEFEGNLRFS